MAPGDQSPVPQDADLRPLVAGRSSNRAAWAFAFVLAAVAAGLFIGLEARRTATGGQTLPSSADVPGAMIAGPPELAVPQGDGAIDYFPPFAGNAGPPALLVREPAATIPATTGQAPIAVPRATFPPPPSYIGPPRNTAPEYQSPAPAGPALTAELPAPGAARTSASWLASPSRTVPQGTVIHAVLETALDSTKAGYARAIVSRDVTSFDGSRVLIPRGSKLFGEYAADLNFGQKRALIQWHRLTRPDGAIIDVDSPSADRLGRAGVQGRVNSHFFQRFSGAILQSALDAGVQLATRAAAGDTVILGLPNSTQAVGGTQRPDEIRPTLKLRQGSSVAVFVARDLDFTTVDP